MLTVTIYSDADSIAQDEGKDFDVDYVSLFTRETYGAPALIAPDTHDQAGRRTARAKEGDEVLYLNTNLIPAFKIRRTAD